MEWKYTRKFCRIRKASEKTLPNNYLTTSIPDENEYYHRFSDSPFGLEASGDLPASTLEQMLISIHDSEKPLLDKPFEIADSGSESGINTAQAWNIVVEEDSYSVNNNHQYSNIQISPIIQADNLGNEHELIPPDQAADDKVPRLEHQRERQRERRKDPVYAERERKHQRERLRELYKDPAYAKKQKEYRAERLKKLNKDADYAEHNREYQRERRKDPVYLEHVRKCQRERRRERLKDPVYVEQERTRRRERERKNRKDPVYVEQERQRQRELRKNPVYAEYRREYQRKNRKNQEQRIYVKTYNRVKRQTSNKEEAAKMASIAREQYLQSINSTRNPSNLPQTSNLAKTTENSSENFEGAPPHFQVD